MRTTWSHTESISTIDKLLTSTENTTKVLELKQTQFYPDKDQKKAGFGDDVLWVGSTLGLGTLRGWDGSKPTMLTDVDKRSQRIIHAAHYVQLLKLRMLHGVRNLVRNQ